MPLSMKSSSKTNSAFNVGLINSLQLDLASFCYSDIHQNFMGSTFLKINFVSYDSD